SSRRHTRSKRDWSSDVCSSDLGSTFKIITLASALEENAIDLEKDKFNDTGSIKVSGSKLRCWKEGGHGEQTMLEVVENPCNPGFVTIGQKVGKEKLFDYI